ncbi:interferon-induced, double-stranded RNA-activated protein kinase isoform X2 [Triplophysa rosa]|uniref:non-specific serine/threonine protein kinase n=1 Tax=Triplophysa rosa TaxID=992332 RepID=A0A9W7T2L4_TRIRA|nr:interferon-induced, double-stranded RNA-activated protein kinase isoform X2 [Triplophysa rosa]KAI7790360.1 double-stranded RNA-dependent protein kinase [Triplophysa rosa]
MEILAETYVSKLNEYQQKTGFKVQYEEGSTEGPSHDKTFTCTAVVNGTRHPEATGKTKKEAKQNAARNAFTAIRSTHNTPFCPNPTPNNFHKKIIARQNPISWLNEYSQRNRVEFKLREFTKTDPASSTPFFTYVCKYVRGDKEYPEAYGKSKKEAKEAAAKYVYEELSTNSEGHDKNCSNAPGSEMSALSANMDHCSLAEDSQSSTPDNNYITYLNEYCQKHNCVIDYKLIDKRGPAHTPEFVYKVVIDGTEFSEGHGKSTKEAKQHAAQKGWTELQQRSDGNTQSSEEDTSSQTSQIHKSAESKMCTSVSSSSGSVVFRDPVSSPMAVSPAMSPVDVKPKIRLAPNFNLSPSASSKIKGDASNMNITNQTKPSSNPTVTQVVKSRFFEDFDSISRVGKGFFGRVFKARRKLENQYFAVKIVKVTKKSWREVAALSKLNHPNIVRYNTCWVEETSYRPECSESNSTSDSGSSLDTEFLYIQMELCEGDTLHVWINQRNSLNEDTDTERRKDATHIFHQILQAVQYIHSKELIHRDLKPANIMFGSEGGVKVGDFGLVTAVDNDDEQQKRSRKTGTRSYMSPEQLTQFYDKKVDIFALGLIYFELLWKLETVNEKSKIWGDIKGRKFPPQFSKKFDFEHKLIHEMLNDNSKDRPEAGELTSELRNCSTVFKNN